MANVLNIAVLEALLFHYIDNSFKVVRKVFP